MPIENVFSWSKSRDEQFAECERKYYFDKYGSWGGWDSRSDERTRMLYVLKNLKNRFAWKGEAVHHIIEHVLKSRRIGKTLSFEEASNALSERMRKDYRESKAKKYFEEPKKAFGLFEHEYASAITDSGWKEVHDGAVACLKNFYSSDLYHELMQDDLSNWLIIEDLEEFFIEGDKIYVKLDFARKKDGIIEIYDWKTGKSDEESTKLQMSAYSLYAMDKWKVPLSSIRCLVLNIGGAKPIVQVQPLSDSIVDKSRKFMLESISKMKARLVDPVKNLPKPEDEFAFAKNTKFCRYCNFYRVCPQFNH